MLKIHSVYSTDQIPGASWTWWSHLSKSIPRSTFRGKWTSWLRSCSSKELSTFYHYILLLRPNTFSEIEFGSILLTSLVIFLPNLQILLLTEQNALSHRITHLTSLTRLHTWSTSQIGSLCSLHNLRFLIFQGVVEDADATEKLRLLTSLTELRIRFSVNQEKKSARHEDRIASICTLTHLETLELWDAELSTENCKRILFSLSKLRSFWLLSPPLLPRILLAFNSHPSLRELHLDTSNYAGIMTNLSAEINLHILTRFDQYERSHVHLPESKLLLPTFVCSKSCDAWSEHK